jgi:hypothetical protein
MASIVVAGDTSGTVTLAAPAVSGTTTLTLPTTSGTLVVNSGAQTIEFADGSASAPSITNSGDTNTGMFFPAADTIAFSEGGVEAMRLDSSGNIGIGVSNPGNKLSLPNNAFVSFRNTSAAETGYIGMTTGNLMSFSDKFYTDASGNLLVGSTSNIGPGAGRIAITSPDLLSTVAGLGVKNNTNNTGGSFAFWVNSSNSIIGTISQNSSTTVGYNTSSDYRLKENIAPMTGALAKVSALKPVTYTWKADGSDGQGFIAHELAEVIPDCVSGEKDAVNEDGSIKAQGVDTSFLVATLTAAIQEQQAIIETLKADIAELKAKVK